MMGAREFLEQVIIPTLDKLGLDGPAAEQLLLGTAAQESQFRDIPQINGPALGYFQIEPETHDDVWKNYLKYKPLLAAKVRQLLPEDKEPDSKWLLGFPAYECAVARIIYLRAQGEIPNDLVGQASYYKQHYNTPEGAATTEEYQENFRRYCGDFPVTSLKGIA